MAELKAKSRAPGGKSGLLSGSRGQLTKKNSQTQSGMQRSQIRQRSKLMSNSRHRMEDGDMDDSWLEAKDPVKPADQLELSEEELKKEFTRLLNANNPNAPDNIIRFSFKDMEYRQLGTVEQTAFHFSLDGCLVHKESDEARRQISRQKFATKKTKTVSAGTSTEEDAEAQAEPAAADADAEAPAAADGEGAAEGAEGGEGGEEGAEGNAEAKEEAEEEEEEEAEDAGEGKLLRNQFNFSERAAQTFNYSMKERGTMTEPPQRQNFAGVVNQHTIFEAYVAHLEKAKAQQAQATTQPTAQEGATDKDVERQEDSASPWASAAKIVHASAARKMERMVNQNTYEEVISDFAYYDDPSDEFKEGKGSVLPLWKFAHQLTKKMTVTALVWNPRYPDMFAVAYGSYDFVNQTDGAVMVFSLKNPSYPEFVIRTTSGAMCVSFHEEHSSLLAVGCYDGTVLVYDLAAESLAEPLYRSTARSGKHTDPVWQVAWQPDDMNQNPNFCSISSDGRVTQWTLVKKELVYCDVIELSGKSTNPAAEPEEDELLASVAGTCFDFHRTTELLYVVGTEEGKIFKCSKAYSSRFLQAYSPHSMAVYAVRWNPYHPSIFASCGADWTVRIFDHERSDPIFSFDLGDSVGDVAWAPFSSTTFAAVTTSGTVYLFDLSQNKHEPLCEQPLLKKGKLTHVAFSTSEPVLLVGDTRGLVHCLKLSPNLRKAAKDKKLREPESQKALMDKVLDSVIERPATEIAAATASA